MRVNRIEDPAGFFRLAQPLLLEDEARHNLALGIAGNLRDHPGLYDAFGLWLVEAAGEVACAALQTHPFNLVVTRAREPTALERLADALAADGVELPGVTGAVPEVEWFATAWERITGATIRARMRQRIYEATEVHEPTGVAGRPRPATDLDRELLVSWVERFAGEVHGDATTPASDAERAVDARLRQDTGAFVLWELDHEPVSLAGWGGRTPSGVRVGPVYTPPEHRRHGYGSAVTAAVSAEQLAAGRRFCFLYTDLANPTSNRIYVDIGYRPVCDSVDFVFEMA